jgi:succinate dehydrogenase / fumarate reductase cytochrome b subunit
MGGSSPWASRNMIVSGSVVLAFLALHFYDFWVPEMVYKYVDASPLNETRYFHELAENLKVQFVWIFPIISIIIIALVARVQFFFSIRWVLISIQS